jgi:hypothetical protein
MNLTNYMTPAFKPTPVILPPHEVLEACRSGLSKRIKDTNLRLEKQRLKAIRAEIDFLIDAL